jgi:4-amino-4-deoxy-L-arabinose transferase-like glycosyltransferase
MRTPGYPLFLVPFVAASKQPAAAIVFVQHLLACLLTAWLYLGARRLTGSRGAALIAALLFALDPPTIHHANKVLSETLFTFLLFGAFLLTIRLVERRRLLLAVADGLLVGFLVLVRPVAIFWFVPVAVALWVGLGRTDATVAWRVRIVMAFTAAALLFPVAWGLRNRLETGVFTVSSIGGANLLEYRAAGALAMEEGGPFASELALFQRLLSRDADEALLAEYGVPASELPHAIVGETYGRLARPILLAHPLGLLELTARGLLVNLFDSDFEAVMVVSRIHPDLLESSLDAVTIAVVLFALLGLPPLWRRNRPAALLLALTIVYFVVISAGGESEARFRLPVTPLLAIAAGVGVTRQWSQNERPILVSS